jgi:hypothetical protein
VFFTTPVSLLFVVKEFFKDLRKVTSDNSSSFIACFDVDSYIKDVDRVEPLA